ncbi:unnamed protein product [Orchesella dallaii]|uniref:F-box domain-containing protein n=1 Tax=Orchesella dallaii TaxID=48710 RepID=A0ABP1RK38_9HEXA
MENSTVVNAAIFSPVQMEVIRQTNADQETNYKQKDEEKVCDGLDLRSTYTLPEEIWKIIFEMLELPDMISCNRACSTWRNYLLRERTLFLFQEVLQLLRNRLQPWDVLPCRQVCKTWRNVVDNAPFLIKWPTRFRRPQFIERFMGEMRLHTDNPFPHRCITLHHRMLPEERGGELIEDDDFFENRFENSKRIFWEKVKELLEKFGKHVWVIYLFPDQLYRDEDDENFVLLLSYEECVRNCLIRLPNLTYLTLNCECTFFVEDMNISNRIINFLALNSLPRLHQLERVDCSMSVPDALVDCILEDCCVTEVVKGLDLETGFHDAIYSFPNLEELEAHLYVEDLERLSIPIRPLRKVYLTIYSRMAGAEEIDFERVFTILNQFPMTLSHVEIKGNPVLRMRYPVNSFRINLPKLEYLKLGEYDGPLDPIIALSNLTNLVILNCNVNSSPMVGSLVEFEGFESRIMESNIWTLLPLLEYFSYKVTNANGHFKKNCFSNRQF